MARGTAIVVGLSIIGLKADGFSVAVNCFIIVFGFTVLVALLKPFFSRKFVFRYFCCFPDGSFLSICALFALLESGWRTASSGTLRKRLTSLSIASLK